VPRAITIVAVKRPSRGFLWAAFGLLLVATALEVLLVRMQPPPPVRSLDVWMRVDRSGDPRTTPDGPPMLDWAFVGSGDALPANPGRMPFIVLVPGGKELPSTFDLLRARITGDQSRLIDAHHLYWTEDIVATPSGKWQRYSTDWWKRPGTNRPPQTAPTAK
jgi:hypothetical protein